MNTVNTILSNKYNMFMKDAGADFLPILKIDTEELPLILKDFKYPVSAWPVLISENSVTKLKKLSEKLPEYLNKIPALYFDNDLQKIANYYYNGNEMLAQFAMICHSKNIETSCRLDLTYSDKSFQVLEVNIGSDLGGKEMACFEPQVRKLHTSLTTATSSQNYTSANTGSLYVKFIIEQISKYTRNSKERMHVFLGMDNVPPGDFKNDTVQFLQESMEAELKDAGMKVRVVTGEMSALKNVQGDLFLNDMPIHAVLVIDGGSRNISEDVFRSFIADKIYFPDHLANEFLKDKRNLALLIELAQQKKFSEEDNQLILNHIPWTQTIDDRTIMYKGEQYNLLELLSAKKDEFVIKVAVGSQGQDVFVGKYCTEQEWEDKISLAQGKTPFIAQEFSESMDFWAPNSNNQWTPHKLIWGAFGFGKIYGGVWVRMSASTNDAGVINSATGAVEAIVYEYKD